MNTNLKHIKHSGFKTPEGYFNTLEDTVFNKLNTKSNLEKIDNTGFNIPENYFASVENNVLNTLKENTNEVKVVSLFSKRNLLYFSGIAASVIIMFSIYNSESKITFDSIDTELVELYMATQHISSEDLATLWNESDFNEIDFNEFEFLDDTVEDYILNNSNIEDLLID